MTRTALDMTGERWSHYPGEIPLFHDLAADCGPEAVIVNIGVGMGTSCVAWLEGNPSAIVVGIDIAQCQHAEINWSHTAIDRSRIIRVVGDSQNMVWPWPFDLAFIDGDHHPLSVRADYERWGKGAKKWIVFHDYHNPVCVPVGPAVDEIMGRKPDRAAGYLAAYRVG